MKSMRKHKNSIIVSLSLLVLIVAVAKPKQALAAVGGSSGLMKGWDIYGRIPHDNWLYSMWTLTDPNLLKRSIVESVTYEMPYALYNLNKRKRIDEVLNVVTGMSYFLFGVGAVSLLYRGGIRSYQNKVAKEDAVRGYKLPTSAISKKAPKSGKKIQGMGDGWIDMENYEDDDDGGNSNKDKDDEDDNDIVDKKKKKQYNNVI